jgi:hypothetical protein
MAPDFGSPEADATPCCTELRCKSMYYRSDERPGMLHHEDAMGYWCSRTNEPMGPDASVARHADCQPGRGCFKPPVG